MNDWCNLRINESIIEYLVHRDALLKCDLSKEEKIYFNDRLTFDFNRSISIPIGTISDKKEYARQWNRYSDLIEETIRLIQAQ